MGLELQIYPLYNEKLRKSLDRDIIFNVLNMDLGDNTQLEEQKKYLNKKNAIDTLKGNLVYDLYQLAEENRMCFILEDDVVAYIQIKTNKYCRTSIVLDLFRTSNNNNKKNHFRLPQVMKLSINQEFSIKELNIPYLGTTVLEIFFQEYCKQLHIENIKIKAIGGARGFYTKALDFLQKQGVIYYYEQNSNEFDIFL